MTVHILDMIRRLRDGRIEAIAMCGEAQECIGTGKHRMVHSYERTDCHKCKRLEVKRKAMERVQDYEW